MPQQGSALLIGPATGRVRRDPGDPVPLAVTTLRDGRLPTATGSGRPVVAPAPR